MKKCIIFIAFSALISASSSAQVESVDYKRLADEFVNSLTQAMKDPNSAVIKDVVVVKKSKTAKPFVCANVNGKNSYGGYTGFQLYSGSPDKPRSKEDYTDILADLWPRVVASCENGPFVYQRNIMSSPQPSVQINIQKDLNDKLEAYATLNDLNSSSDAAEEIIRKYFSK